MIELGDDDMGQGCECYLAGAMAFTGVGAWTMISQARQLFLGRIWQMTRQLTCTTASISLASALRGRKAPSHPARSGARHRFMNDLEARQVRRQCPVWCAIGGGLAAAPIPTHCGCVLELLKRQLELGGLVD